MAKKYKDTIHGFTVATTSRQLAWWKIKQRCEVLHLEVPNLEQII